MKLRDVMWLTVGWMAGVMAVSVWWQDVKTGVKHVGSITPLVETMGQVEKVAETHSQLQAVEKINEAAFVKQWSAVERKLKALQAELNKTNQALEQHKKEHAVMVASKPGGHGAYDANRSLLPTRDSLPAHHLVRLAKEVGFTTIRVQQ